MQNNTYLGRAKVTPDRVKIKLLKTYGIYYAKDWFVPNQIVICWLISQAGMVGLNYVVLY